MGSRALARLLKVIDAVLAVASILFVALVVPNKGTEIANTNPDLAWMYWPCMALAAIAVIIAAVIGVLMWLVCSDMEIGEMSTPRNSRRLKAMSVFAILEAIVFAIATGVFFVLKQIQGNVLTALLVIIIVFLVLGILFFALSVLVIKLGERKVRKAEKKRAKEEAKQAKIEAREAKRQGKQRAEDDAQQPLLEQTEVLEPDVIEDAPDAAPEEQAFEDLPFSEQPDSIEIGEQPKWQAPELPED